MKEIKFRAWCPEQVICGKVHQSHYRYSDDYNDLEHFFGNVSIYRNHIIEQFIGLKDQNGKNIYEDDIVSIQERFSKEAEPFKATLSVLFHQDAYFGKFLTKYIRYDIGNMIPMSLIPNCKVIGNVHENPELLA